MGGAGRRIHNLWPFAHLPCAIPELEVCAASYGRWPVLRPRLDEDPLACARHDRPRSGGHLLAHPFPLSPLAASANRSGLLWEPPTNSVTGAELLKTDEAGNAETHKVISGHSHLILPVSSWQVLPSLGSARSKLLSPAVAKPLAQIQREIDGDERDKQQADRACDRHTQLVLVPEVVANESVCQQKQEPGRRLHFTIPASGLDAVAYSFFWILPARNALRPASTAARIASAISTASCAPAIAVFIRTPSAPNSIAIAASEAVPTPASTMSGTSVMRSRRMRRLARFWIPRPEPIGAPRGITAAAPAP